MEVVDDEGEVGKSAGDEDVLEFVANVEEEGDGFGEKEEFLLGGDAGLEDSKLFEVHPKD